MNAITINSQKLSIKEYNGNRVITFKEVDGAHGRPEGTARRNFNSNKAHFIEGEDFYKIQPNEIRTVGINSPNGAIVLTESGYLMLAKSFTDELAWQVQRQLVKSYFRVKAEIQTAQPKPSKPYEYFDKYYKGIAVLTAVDVEHFTGYKSWNVSRTLANYSTKGIDWLLLEGKELADFKRENPQYDRCISHLTIVFKSGFDILLKVIGATSDVECFKMIEAPAKTETPPKWLYVDMDNSKELKEQIKKARKFIDTFDTLLSSLEQHTVEENNFKHTSKTIAELALNGAVQLVDVKNKQYTTTPKYIEG